MSTIKVGIIGTGFGKVIGQNFKAVSPNIGLYFSGRSIDKLNAIKKELNIAQIYTNWQDLVKNPELNLLVIACHSAGHLEMYKFASDYCKNILIEKPAALTSKEVLEMLQIKNRSKILKNVIVNHEGRFHPIIDYLKRIISERTLGKILTMRIGAYLNWYSTPDYKENWNQHKQEGGGQIFSIGTHQIDLARYLLGNPDIINGSVQSISYSDPRFSKNADADTQFSAQFVTEEHTSLQFFNDCYCHGYKDFVIEIIGSRGIIMYSDVRGLSISQSNLQPLEKIEIKGDLDHLPLGSSILSKSMKYKIYPLINLIEHQTVDPRFSTLEDEVVNLELFEKYK